MMARRGRSTRTVRMAERLTLCPSREYSIMLGRAEGGGSGGGQVTTRWRAGSQAMPQPGWTLSHHGALLTLLDTPCPSAMAVAGTGIPRTSVHLWQRPYWLPTSSHLPDQAAPGPLQSAPVSSLFLGDPRPPRESEGVGFPARLGQARGPFGCFSPLASPGLAEWAAGGVELYPAMTMKKSSLFHVSPR